MTLFIKNIIHSSDQILNTGGQNTVINTAVVMTGAGVRGGRGVDNVRSAHMVAAAHPGTIVSHSFIIMRNLIE